MTSQTLMTGQALMTGQVLATSRFAIASAASLKGKLELQIQDTPTAPAVSNGSLALDGHTALSLSAGAPKGYDLATASSSDGGTAAISYSLGGDDQAFSINATTGVISLSDPAALPSVSAGSSASPLSLTVTASNSYGSASSTIDLSIDAVPVFAGHSIAGPKSGGTIVIPTSYLIGSDTSFSVTGIAASFHGKAVLAADGKSISFTDQGGMPGGTGSASDAFVATLSDGHGGTAQEKIKLVVGGASVATTIDTLTMHSHDPLSISVADLMAEVKDPFGLSLSFKGLDAEWQGSTALSPDGTSIVFSNAYEIGGDLVDGHYLTPQRLTPALTTASDPDAFTFTVEDSLGNVFKEKVNIAVVAVDVSVNASTSLSVASDGNIDHFTIAGGTHTITLDTQPDVLIFNSKSFGEITVSGFHPALSNASAGHAAAYQDTLQFAKTAFGSLASYAEMMVHASQVGADTMINIDSHDYILLKGVAKSQITAADLHFV